MLPRAFILSCRIAEGWKIGGKIPHRKRRLKSLCVWVCVCVIFSMDTETHFVYTLTMHIGPLFMDTQTYIHK